MNRTPKPTGGSEKVTSPSTSIHCPLGSCNLNLTMSPSDACPMVSTKHPPALRSLVRASYRPAWPSQRRLMMTGTRLSFRFSSVKETSWLYGHYQHRAIRSRMVSLPPAIVCKTLVQSKKNIDITRRFPQEGTVNKFIIDFLIRAICVQSWPYLWSRILSAQVSEKSEIPPTAVTAVGGWFRSNLLAITRSS